MQQSSAVHRLNTRNCVELVAKLIQLGKLDVRGELCSSPCLAVARNGAAVTGATLAAARQCCRARHRLLTRHVSCRSFASPCGVRAAGVLHVQPGVPDTCAAGQGDQGVCRAALHGEAACSTHVHLTPPGLTHHVRACVRAVGAPSLGRAHQHSRPPGACFYTLAHCLCTQDTAHGCCPARLHVFPRVRR